MRRHADLYLAVPSSIRAATARAIGLAGLRGPVVRMAALVLAIVAAAALPGCARRAELPVTLQFNNVRSVVLPGSVGGETRGEWDQIWPTVIGHHKVRNRLDLRPTFESTDPVVDQIAGVEVRDYTATIVVDGFQSLPALHRDLDKLQGTEIAPGRRLQISLSDVSLGFSGNFISARRTETVQGRSLPGATVVLYDRDADSPRVVRADGSGAWVAPVETSPGQRAIVGYSVPPGARDRPETRRHFRIDLATNIAEDINERRFNNEIDSMRGGVGGFVARITG
ncbi:MAG: hypothetical protein AAFX79_10310 [Planctomycetota bacterium]